MRRNRFLGLAGAAAGVAAGLAAERVALRRRRRDDPEADEPFGRRRGERSYWTELDDGARIFVEEVGPEARRGAVFVHGSVLRTDEWHYQMTGLGGHRLIFYDMRGHGLSHPKGSLPFSMETLASDLGHIITTCGLEEVVVVGHSVGGMTAMELCKRSPELVGSTIKGIVLANATYRPPVETILGGAALTRLERVLKHPVDALGSHAHRIDHLRKIIRPSDAVFWGVALSAFGPRASARQIDFTYDMLAETPSDVLFDFMKCYRDYDVRDTIPDVTVPVTIISGTHDRLTLPAASRYLAENLPKAELHLLEGAGHMTMLERHEEFNSIVEKFLVDVLGPPDTEKRE